MLKEISKRIVLIIITLPLVLIILEAGIRIAVPQPVDEIAYEDIYTKRFSPALNYNVKSLVPGMTRIKNNAEIHINNNGNRDYEYQQKKIEGVKRIAIVGSSVAFGFKLKLDDTFGKQLERNLNENSTETEYEVLLFGRPGFRAKETYACIKDRVFSYSPDLIIYSFVQNNYEDQTVDNFFSTQNDLANVSKTKKVNSSESLLKKIRKYWWKIRNHDFGRFIRSNFHLYLFSVNSIANILRELSPIEKEKAQNIAPLYTATPEFKQKIYNTESWISLINSECMKKNIKFAILMHPYEIQLNKYGVEKWIAKGIQIPEDVLERKTHQMMKAFSVREAFYFIDIVPALNSYKGRSDHLYLDGDYGHYDIVGNQIIADHLVEEMFHLLK